MTTLEQKVTRKDKDFQNLFMRLRRVSMATGCLLDNYEELKSLSVYRHRLKNYGTMFFDEITKLEDSILQPVEGEAQEVFTGAVEQASLLYNQLNVLIDLTYAIAEMKPEHQLAFEHDFNLLLQRYSIRL